MSVVRDTVSIAVVASIGAIGCAGSEPVPDSGAAAGGEAVEYESLEAGEGDPVFDGLVYDEQPAGAEAFERCHRRQPNALTTVLGCAAGTFVRVTRIPEDHEGLPAVMQQLDQQEFLETDRTEIRFVDGIRDAVEFQGSVPQTPGDQQQRGLIVEDTEDGVRRTIECTRIGEPESFDDRRCLELMASMREISLDELGTRQATEVQFFGRELPLPSDCQRLRQRDVRCGDTRMTWTAASDAPRVEVMRDEQGQRIRQGVVEQGGTVVSEREFDCEIVGRQSDCREIVLHVPVAEGDGYLVAYDAAVDTGEAVGFVACSTWMAEEPDEDDPIPTPLCGDVLE